MLNNTIVFWKTSEVCKTYFKHSTISYDLTFQMKYNFHYVYLANGMASFIAETYHMVWEFYFKIHF